MEIYHCWLIAAIVLVVLELLSSGFAILCFALGCVAAAVGAALQAGWIGQLSLLIVFSLLAFFFVRPFMLKYMSRGKEVATNADALIGREAVVTEPIDATQDTGRVKIDGDDWKAVSPEATPLPLGSRVKVLSRDGLILTVTPIAQYAPPSGA